MLNSRQRAFLRGRANTLETIFQIGKQDITENMTADISRALEKRELIKLHVLENSGLTAREAARQIADATRSEVVQVIGGRFILYRESKTLPADLRIKLP